MGKKKQLREGIEKAFKKGGMDLGEFDALVRDFGRSRVTQQVARAMAANEGYNLDYLTMNASGLNRTRRNEITYRPPDPQTWNIAAGIMNLGGGQSNGPRVNTDSPGRGWVNNGTFSRGGYGNYHNMPRYVYQGGTRGAAGTGGGGKKNNGDPDRSTGKYDDIIAALQMDAELGREQQEAFANMLTESNYNTMRIVSDLTGSITANSEQNTQALRDAAAQQAERDEENRAQQAESIAQGQALLQEQQRQSDALSRAFVPELQDVAVAPVVGDYRSGQSRNSNTLGYNSTSSNTLSGLAILGSPSTSLSGLRIA